MITLSPIGTFHADSKHPYEAPRQATAATPAINAQGEIRLVPGQDFEQALADLEGFERIWIVYHFHHNSEWKPKVMPPRGPRVKRGVFATRAPYRPNPIGISCVRLIKVEGLKITIEGHDLLDGTPILDIKPYLPYADAFPEAKVGWLEEVESEAWQITFTDQAKEQIEWLTNEGVTQLNIFIQSQLQFDPFDHKRKRVAKQDQNWRLSYRTWRINFKANEQTRTLEVQSIKSGYSNEELNESKDKYGDKKTHKTYNQKWPTP